MTSLDNPITSTANLLDREVFTVSQLNRRAKQLLETHLPLLWVEGELSNISLPSSGHWYFTLKDDQAQVRCAMFRNRNMYVRFAPRQGQHVLLRARVSLYEGRGDYQLIAEHMEDAGAGALQRAFEELKQKLANEGLFTDRFKLPIPKLPRRIAVITSPTGAAIRDVLTVLARRFPAIPVTLLPVAVQGKEAAPQIVRAIDMANRAGWFDVILLVRGGGSLEDLWAFNDEGLARAIHASPLPIVCGVGHEVDITIADLAADLRAPTPSAAAELVTPDGEEWLETFIGYEVMLEESMQRRLQQAQQKLAWLRARLRHPGEALQQQAQRLDGLEVRLNHAIHSVLRREHNRLETLILRQKPLHPGQCLKQYQARVKQILLRLGDLMDLTLQRQKSRLAESLRVLQTVNPLRTLERGYAIASKPNGEVIHRSNQVTIGEKISIQLSEGTLISRVENID